MPAPLPPPPALSPAAGGQFGMQRMMKGEKGKVPAAVALPVTTESDSVSVPAFAMPPPLRPFSAGQLRSGNGVHPWLESPGFPPVIVTALIVTWTLAAMSNTCVAPPPSMIVFAAPAPLMIVFFAI